MSYDCVFTEIFNNPRFSMFVADHLPELKEYSQFDEGIDMYGDMLRPPMVPTMCNNTSSYYPPVQTLSIPSTPTFSFDATFAGIDQQCFEGNNNDTFVFNNLIDSCYSEYSTPSPSYSEFVSSEPQSTVASPIPATKPSSPATSSSSPVSSKHSSNKKQQPSLKPISAISKKDDDSYAKRKRKQAIVWTKELHNEFTKAVAQLGETARPKAILENMKSLNPNISLSRDMVASHLQRFRKGFVKPTSLPVQAIA